MTARDEDSIGVEFAMISFEVTTPREMDINGLGIEEHILQSSVNCALSSPYINSNTYEGVCDAYS